MLILQIIGEANQMIASEYDVTIDEDNFSYSVGKPISENEFVSLDSEKTLDLWAFRKG